MEKHHKDRIGIRKLCDRWLQKRLQVSTRQYTFMLWVSVVVRWMVVSSRETKTSSHDS